MKALVAFCLIFVSGVHSFGRSFDPELYEIIIREWIECARGALTDGIPELDFPSFNPLNIKDRHFPITEDLFEGNFEVREAYLDGLQKFELAHLKITTDPATLVYEVVINSTLHGEYEIGSTGKQKEIPVTGKGAFNFNTLLNIKGQVQLTQDGTEIQSFYTFFKTLPHFTIDGLNSDDGQFVKGWEDLVLAINGQQEEINDFLGPYLVKFGNSLLDLEGSPEIAAMLELVMTKCP